MRSRLPERRCRGGEIGANEAPQGVRPDGRGGGARGDVNAWRPVNRRHSPAVHARNLRTERVSATGRPETRLFMRDCGTSHP